MTRLIPLTQGKQTIVDDKDFELLSKFKWCYSVGYAARRDSRKSFILMHRVIIKTPNGMLTDHINGNGLDNRRSNLRICTKSQNMMNATGKRTNNTSGFIGVSWNVNAHKWAAQLMVNGKHIHFGYFDNPIDAARAHDEGALRYHGNFAKLNFEKG
jgi:hypothetical protein